MSPGQKYAKGSLRSLVSHLSQNTACVSVVMHVDKSAKEEEEEQEEVRFCMLILYVLMSVVVTRLWSVGD